MRSHLKVIGELSSCCFVKQNPMMAVIQAETGYLLLNRRVVCETVLLMPVYCGPNRLVYSSEFFIDTRIYVCNIYFVPFIYMSNKLNSAESFITSTRFDSDVFKLYRFSLLLKK